MKLILCSHKEGVLTRWRKALQPIAPGSPEIPDASGLLRFPLGDRIVLLHLPVGIEQPDRLVASLVGQFPASKVMVFRDLPDDGEGLSMLRVGAAGYCNSHMNPPLLRMAVDIVSRGEIWAGQALIRRLISAVAGADMLRPSIFDFHGLTTREREIALQVASGASNKRIAQKLDITERTVKAHMSSLFRKTGARDRLQLALQINSGREGRAA